MAIKRSEQIDTENGGYYHLISRCVRRAFLCGIDEKNGINYDYRRQWIEKRILELADIFSIEVYAYAVMHNHYHLVIYLDPKLSESWSDLLATYRERLGSVPWLMKRINEPLAKMANKEDFCKDHFLGSRFKSQALLDETAALTCMAYVDLNPIRAGIAKSLPESEHTGIKKRLESLSPEKLEQTMTAIAGKVKNKTMVIKLRDYVELVEWTGKAIIYPNKATFPPSLCATLNHMNLKQANWLGQVQGYGSHYHRFVGSIEQTRQKTTELKLKWLKGISQIQQLYNADT